jgi:hypothetical protein
MYGSILIKKISLLRALFSIIYRADIKRKNTYSLCSFQKSGRTWVRYFLANYINIYYGLNIAIDMHTVYDVVPAYDYKLLNKTLQLIEKFDSDIPLVLSSHTVYKKHLYSKTPIIFVVRSVYDIMVSYYYHKKKHRSEFNGDISTFIRSNGYGMVHFVNYINSWSKYLASSVALIVSYEDMHFDTKNTFSKIISFLNIPMDENLLILAIEKSTFTNMQKSEVNSGIPGHSYNLDDVNARRMRSGVVGDYINHLSSDDIEYIRNYCVANFTENSKKIYKDSRITL